MTVFIEHLFMLGVYLVERRETGRGGYTPRENERIQIYFIHLPREGGDNSNQINLQLYFSHV